MLIMCFLLPLAPQWQTGRRSGRGSSGVYAGPDSTWSSSGLRAKRSRNWSTDDLIDFLDSCKLGHLKAVFRDNGMDGEFLLSQSDMELIEELGLSKLQVKKIRLRLPQ